MQTPQVLLTIIKVDLNYKELKAVEKAVKKDRKIAIRDEDIVLLRMVRDNEATIRRIKTRVSSLYQAVYN